MHKRAFLLAAACAGLALGGGSALAGAPIKGVIVKGGHNPGSSAGKMLVTLNLTEPQTWAYDPKGGTLLPAEPEPSEIVDPVPGIGIVVKKNPGGGASILQPGKTGQYDLPEKMDNGMYDLVVTLPAEALKGIRGKGVNLNFTLVKNDSGVFNLIIQPTPGDSGKGTGSPKVQGF